ncbi:acetate/propionate family kinase [Pseudoprimorskyibacter insulae]|uniref:Acetate kinase n=1 Tax=Pseudoprimorskyibacter insulae TaxID=1695997 RepID=A0A2R8B0U1_9RHOB|nr:acetate/propionate family kinase [Pseudoprimorskyibacter insulae]SPF81902.1 Acetate kinase [Pseudoprimorskyibacter insulae]
MTHVLTLNAGSSTLKFGLFERGEEPSLVAVGKVDRIGGAAVLSLKDQASGDKVAKDLPSNQAGTHGGAVRATLDALQSRFPEADIGAVGHRVVHGGLDHADPVVLTDDILDDLRGLVTFAPLHQPHNLAGVSAALAEFPDAVQVACFDTAFHRGQPFESDAFALPRRYYDAGVRRYGFHGLSYAYIASVLKRQWPGLHTGRTVVAHLGNGASMSAIHGGRSVASTMGFTALDGLPMGTRCGQVDPGVLLYMMDQEGLSTQQVTNLLYKGSGLLGLSGISHDMRELLASDDLHAKQAIDYFCARICHETAGLAAAMGGIDALVFTGGIGENAAPIRAQVCNALGWLGLDLDVAANHAAATDISADSSAIRAMVIPTNEELMIARAASALSD